MEIFDVINELGEPTGKTVERSIAHTQGVRHRTAHIWIMRKREGRVQILLQKRSANKDSFPGRFDTSSAGHVQAGDQPLESALRELSEELGIYADDKDLEFAGTFPILYKKKFYGKFFQDNEIAFVYLYRKPVETSKLKLQKEEVEEVQWFDLEDTLTECKKKNQKFCVPLDGLELIRNYIKDKGYM